MPDSNDIVYEGHQLDFVFIGRELFDMFGIENFSFSEFISFLQTMWNVYTVFAFVISIILVVAMIYAYIRYNQYCGLESAYYETQERLWKQLYGKDATNNRWEDIQDHIVSDDPKYWKLAIIEADVMLEETLESAGFAGLTIGDKLKSASPESFKTLQDAWDAHKVRNTLAHSGADFVLTKKSAQETIVQYRRVFQEFGVV
ncbi:MAG: hypothetical protein ACI9VM_000091 [Candidatus Azotimanducaceae bacterium]|jgi:hypothetical protein